MEQNSTPATPAKKNVMAKLQSTPYGSPRFIRACALMLVSVLVLVFAFLPIFTIKVPRKDFFPGMKGKENITFKISALDAVQFFFDSFSNKESDPKLEEKMDKTEEKLEEALNDGKFSGKDQRLFTKLMKYSVRYTLRSEDTKIPFSFTVGALAAALYFVVAFAFVALSGANLAFWFLKKDGKTFETWATRMMFLVPGLAIVTSFAVRMMVSLYYVMNFDTWSYGLGSGVIWALIISVVGVAVLAVLNIMETRKVCIKSIAFRAVAIVLAVVFLATITAPMLDLSVTRSDDKKVSAPMDNSVFYQYLSMMKKSYDARDLEIDTEIMKQQATNYANGVASNTKEEIKEGDNDISVRAAMAGAAGLYMLDKGYGSSFFQFVLYILYFAGLGAALFIAANLSAIVSGEDTKAKKYAALAAGLMVVVLVINIGIILMGNVGAMINEVDKVYNFSIGGGSIFATIFAVAMTFAPLGKYEPKETNFFGLAVPAEGAEEAAEATETAYAGFDFDAAVTEEAAPAEDVTDAE